MSLRRASLRLACCLALLLGALLCSVAGSGGQRALVAGAAQAAAQAAVADGDRDAGQVPGDDQDLPGQGSLEDNSVDDTLFPPAAFAVHLAAIGSAEPRGREAALISGPRLLETRPPIA
jgi:hypothetical protein